MARRVLVTGSRDWPDPSTVVRVLAEHLRPGDVLLEGGAEGADAAAAVYWVGRGGAVESHPVLPEDWKLHGRAAGPLRNRAMVDSGVDLCLAFIHNGSRGATGCLEYARRCGVPSHVEVSSD